tara:strand:+ start:352 stop:534 length:183 start_codon:yes stop_codon:yes gene_type:complete
MIKETKKKEEPPKAKSTGMSKPVSSSIIKTDDKPLHKVELKDHIVEDDEDDDDDDEMYMP